jgi:hypothetical protein
MTKVASSPCIGPLYVFAYVCVCVCVCVHMHVCVGMYMCSGEEG